MAASTLRGRHDSRHNEGLQPTALSSDLRQIAELIEVCFGAKMDAGGRSAVREMKMLAGLGPLLGLMSMFTGTVLGMGLGYVWREAGRVVGNVSLYRGGRHPWLGSGFLIANVAVTPEYRRRGIAREMMVETLQLARRKQGHWVSLQVEADNVAAIELYRGLGFEHLETISQWTMNTFRSITPLVASNKWIVRSRRQREINAEMDLIFRRARVGAIAWTRPISRSEVQEPVGNLMLGTNKEHWVLINPNDDQRLMGALWIDVVSWLSARLTLFLDPALDDLEGRRVLLDRALRLSQLHGRRIRVETSANDPAVDTLLADHGFRKVRTLTLMRKSLE